MKNTNLVRIGKVSFFDLGVSRKSPPLWHFLAVFPALHAVATESARPDLSSNAIATAHDSDKVAQAIQTASITVADQPTSGDLS